MMKNYKLSNDVKDSPRVGRLSKLNSRDQSLLYWGRGGGVREELKISYRNCLFSSKAGYISVSYSTVPRYLNKKLLIVMLLPENHF